MRLKEYQENAIAELIAKANELLQISNGNTKSMVFKSPTGSGKTLMAAEFLRRFVDTMGASSLCFIWTAPRDLHLQSKEKLEKHYAHDSALSCVEFQDLSDGKIGEREILFLNWEKIRQKNNVIIRENERDHYFAKVLEKTRDEGRGIVLIIDESHYHVSKISRELINDIAPKLLVEISATPIFKNPDQFVIVHLEKVKTEGMIKKSVILNPEIDDALQTNANKNPERADKILLQEALKQRCKIADTFQSIGEPINPLLCIQLPDNKNAPEEEPNKEMALQTLKAAGITVENRKLAIHLSDQKENIENIRHNNNETEVIIFKYAIALGWDCPRAHILVLFRNWQSINFSVQTLGRIMRMPDPDTGHYDNELLNNGYVYTNLSEISIHEDVAGGYVRLYTAHRIAEYSLLKLPSVHRLRQREKTRLSPRFVALFLEAAKEYQLKDKIDIDAQTVAIEIISDYTVNNVDEEARGDIIEGNVKINVRNKEDLQKLFDYFARKNLNPYYPDSRSIDRIKTSIYEFFGGPLQMKFVDHLEKIINITLSRKNNKHFIQVLEMAKEKYKAETEQRREPLQKTKQWEVAETNTYGDNYEERTVNKSVLMPFLALQNESTPEKEFINLLEESENVEWWYKNGESESMYFAVPYKKDGEDAPFYVDFIVRYKDGTIGLYDTKSGITIRDSKDKSDGLLAYISDQNKRSKKITGGIVARANPGGWKIYQGKGKDLTDNFTNPGWHTLEI